MSDTVKIEIDEIKDVMEWWSKSVVIPYDPKYYDDLEKMRKVIHHVHKAYEAKKNEIQKDDWYFSYCDLVGGDRRELIGKWMSDSPPTNTHGIKRLPDHLQKSLNEWMDS